MAKKNKRRITMIYLRGQRVGLNFDKPSRLPVPDQLKQLNQTYQSVRNYIPSIDAYQIEQSDYLIDSQNLELKTPNQHTPKQETRKKPNLIHPKHLDPDLIKQTIKRHAEDNKELKHIAQQIQQLIEQQIYIEQLEQNNILEQIREATLKAQRESTIHAYNHLIIKILTLTK